MKTSLPFRLFAAFVALWFFDAFRAQAQTPVDSYNPSVNGPINAVLVQPDNKVVIAGSFTMVGSQVRYGIARLLPDGSVIGDRGRHGGNEAAQQDE